LGTYNQLLKFYRPNIQDENILFADFQFRSELIFNANNNYRFWMHNDHIMSGLDPRGNQLTNNKIYGITLNKKVRKKISIRNEISMKNQRYKSDYLNKSDRKIFSWWNELELQYRFKKNIDLDLSILGGFDEGKFNDTRFNSSSKGIGIKTKYFFKKRGSLDTHVEFINVDGSNNLNFIPPEASQGYPLGRTFKIQSRFQYFITKSFSSIISIYMVDDNRYNKFLNINGELRAYF
jgi:hypothetical protein